jgi:5-methylcytosine-specific restriction endonuclease McrA
MARSNLNTIFNYTINVSYMPALVEENAIDSFTSYNIKNWESRKNGIKSFKKNIRLHLEPKQKERCAYCRQFIQASGKGEHLDHIVAKDDRPQWMFISQNLVLSCSGCNTPKNATLVLNSPHSRRTVNFPDISAAFKIFNPYYDIWSDHFIVDDEIFIQAKPGTKGDFTMKTCKLFRQQVVINNVRLLRMKKGNSKKKITQRLYLISKGTDEYQELLETLAQVIRTS